MWFMLLNLFFQGSFTGVDEVNCCRYQLEDHMKRLICLIVFIIAIGSGNLLMGDDINYSYIGFDQKLPLYSWVGNFSGGSITYNESIMCSSIFVDFAYFNLSLGAGYNIAQPSFTIAGGGSSMTLTASGVADTYVDLAAYFKYPFGSENFKFWPAIGIDKLFFIQETENGSQNTSSADDTQVMSPTFLKLGVGCNIIIQNFVIMPSFFYGYDLTATTSSGQLDSVPISSTYGSSFIISVSFGFQIMGFGGSDNNNTGVSKDIDLSL